jgi:hypothetical protein
MDVQGTEEAFRPQKQTSSNSKHEISEYSFLWVIFARLDPDSESGYGSTDRIESGSNPYPHPKH